MYSLTSANRYYLYQGFVRMNLGIDGLFKIIRSEMKDLSPVSGDIFLFFGKNRQSVKILRSLPAAPFSSLPLKYFFHSPHLL